MQLGKLPEYFSSSISLASKTGPDSPVSGAGPDSPESETQQAQQPEQQAHRKLNSATLGKKKEVKGEKKSQGGKKNGLQEKNKQLAGGKRGKREIVFLTKP